MSNVDVFYDYHNNRDIDSFDSVFFRFSEWGLVCRPFTTSMSNLGL